MTAEQILAHSVSYAGKTVAVSGVGSGHKVCPACRKIVAACSRSCKHCDHKFETRTVARKAKVAHPAFDIIDKHRADKKAAKVKKVTPEAPKTIASLSRTAQLHRHIGETLTKLAYYHMELSKLV
jgi:cation diffusion facilitator CzcD-associated flavoprotein CzcO